MTPADVVVRLRALAERVREVEQPDAWTETLASELEFLADELELKDEMGALAIDAQPDNPVGG